MKHTQNMDGIIHLRISTPSTKVLDAKSRTTTCQAQTLLYQYRGGSKSIAMQLVASESLNKSAPIQKQFKISNYTDFTKEEDRIMIYPNPATENITISYQFSVGTHNAKIQIIDVLGRVLIDKSLEDNTNHMTIPLNQIAHGSYIVKVLNNSTLVYTQKISVEK